MKREQSRIPTGKTTDQATPVQTATAQKSISRPTATPTLKTDKPTESKRAESPVRQVVIQDGLGNLTTVTVGQILGKFVTFCFVVNAMNHKPLCCLQQYRVKQWTVSRNPTC